MKKPLIIFLFTCIFIPQGLFAQPIPDKTYLHMKGGLEGGVKVEMNLVKAGDTLYGDFAYSFADYTRGNFDIRTGEYASVYGKASLDRSFWLKEWGNDKGPLITGVFADSRTLSGLWETAPGAKKVPYHLNERVSKGSVPMQVHYLNEKRLLVSAPSSPAATIKQCILLPSTELKGPVFDTLRRIILECYTDQPGQTSDADLLLRNIQKQFFSDYTSGNEGIYKQMPKAGSLNWVSLKMMHVLYNDHYILSFYMHSYTYTGGAHGMEIQDFTVVHSGDGRIISLTDIFLHGYEQGINGLLTKKLKIMKGLSDQQKLSENGYFADEIELNENFFLTNHGIGFHYNPYEIAPYSNGSTDIFLPFTDLAPYLKDEGMIRTLLGQ